MPSLSSDTAKNGVALADDAAGGMLSTGAAGGAYGFVVILLSESAVREPTSAPEANPA